MSINDKFIYTGEYRGFTYKIREMNTLGERVTLRWHCYYILGDSKYYKSVGTIIGDEEVTYATLGKVDDPRIEELNYDGAVIGFTTVICSNQPTVDEFKEACKHIIDELIIIDEQDHSEIN